MNTYTVNTADLTQAFGSDTDTAGTDGGCFVEFKNILASKGSGAIPKYTSFPNDTLSFEFCTYWFKNAGNNNNKFQLVAANKHDDGSFGTTRDYENICFITTENFSFLNDKSAIAETTAYEVGHLMSDKPSLSDHHNNNNSIDTDGCIMAKKPPRDRDNGIMEFCIECLENIRSEVNPK